MPRPRSIKHYGWAPDIPDQRDHLYAAPLEVLVAMPPAIDLRSQIAFPPVYDQGQLGSCTGNSIAGAIQIAQVKEGIPNFTPSRLFIYYNERVIEGTVATDSGAQIRDGIKTVNQQGACREDPTWPYDISQFAVQPPPAAYQEAANYTVTSYSRLVQNLNQMQGCIASGYPFVFGFTVYESFESQAVANTGIVPMPAAQEQVVGGHAVVAIGYDNGSHRFLVRNSWGPGWGQQGYFTIPYAYLTNHHLASDFWTIRIVK